ncbi:hypothetical protein TUM20985_15440 [Mycobacterium antarcticum]|uniref:hypothetical protein n=1 Tax=unclassified Mycolicibacterium TaxID=2636767 RepID=UPI0023966B32|nr:MULTISPECIES: hypothetical protein [unclassified Mycolicibacterium]BDX30997.1 hypothetical protein TUM20985_15440 [Mycolicibacterium sp. TUM20985]GLP74347.1 hypothetical protein TUM20983_14570 [Mycolicibacterium sp. TUM20983]GLP80144.1 hypothetical protein TUM20984_15640 [Mycolicibacterium sp. TUM20984]
MAKRRSPPRKQRTMPPLPAPRRIEVGPDGYDYDVKVVAASRAVKTYRCPGCDHEIKPSVSHVVVWPADLGESAVEDRRHWHTPCWTNRSNRGPTRTWS